MKVFFLILSTAFLFGQTNSEAALDKAHLFLRQGNLSAAEGVVREYLQAHGQSADAHFLLGSILFTQSKAKESLAEYTEGAKYRAPSAADLKVVGSDYVVLSDFADADKWFSKVVEWSPADVQGWYYLGRTKYNENRFDEAVSAFAKVLQLDPANVKAEDNLGLSYQGLGRNDDAMDAYKRAIGLQEKDAVKNAGPYLDFGSLLSELDRVDEALPLLKKALAISPDDFRVHRELGKVYLHLNNLEKSEVELARAIELAPRNAPLHFMLAQVYRKQGLEDKAKVERERYSALKQEP